MEHRDELVERIATQGTQTNEVNRAVYVAVGLVAATADRPDLPVALVELGASAGLLLGVDRYAVELVSPGSRVLFGDAGSPVRCVGGGPGRCRRPLTQRGLGLPTVGGQVGLDVAPVDLDDDRPFGGSRPACGPRCPAGSNGSAPRGRSCGAIRRTCSAATWSRASPRLPSGRAPGPGPDGPCRRAHLVGLDLPRPCAARRARQPPAGTRARRAGPHLVECRATRVRPGGAGSRRCRRRRHRHRSEPVARRGGARARGPGHLPPARCVGRRRPGSHRCPDRNCESALIRRDFAGSAAVRRHRRRWPRAAA